MDDKLIKKVFKQMTIKTPAKGKCPEEVDLCRFVEDLMDEEETAEVERHLISCTTCCDYVVSFNKVTARSTTGYPAKTPASSEPRTLSSIYPTNSLGISDSCASL